VSVTRSRLLGVTVVTFGLSAVAIIVIAIFACLARRLVQRPSLATFLVVGVTLLTLWVWTLRRTLRV
jgi:hypothetical protein